MSSNGGLELLKVSRISIRKHLLFLFILFLFSTFQHLFVQQRHGRCIVIQFVHDEDGISLPVQFAISISRYSNFLAHILTRLPIQFPIITPFNRAHHKILLASIHNRVPTERPRRRRGSLVQRQRFVGMRRRSRQVNVQI